MTSWRQYAKARLFMLPWIAFPLTIGIVGLFHLSIKTRDERETKQSMARAMVAVESEVEGQIDGAVAFLELLSDDMKEGNIDSDGFNKRFTQYVAAHISARHILWIDAQEVVRWAAPREHVNHLVNSGVKVNALSVAATVAYERHRWQLSEPYVSMFSGKRGFDVVFPVFADNKEFLGWFSCFFAFDSILHRIVPDWVRSSYEVVLADRDHNEFVKVTSGRPVDSHVTLISENLMGSNLRIHLRHYRTPIDWRELILVAVGVGLALGTTMVTVGIARSAAEKSHLAEQMAREKAIAEAASESKTMFLANVSHELRTPIGAMIGYTDLLLRPGSTPSEVDNGLQAIRRNGQSLLELVNDLLDLTKVEAGMLDIELKPVVIREVFEELLRSFMAVLKLKGLVLKVTSAEIIPPWITTDPMRFRQVLTNLISNAIKFTPSGTIEVSLALQRRDNGESRLACAVTDSGIGMSSEQSGQLFQVFSQADHTVARRFGGTGLGLALSKKLARQLGGDLELVWTKAAKGSCFSFVVSAGDLPDVPFAALALDSSQLALPLPTEGAAGCLSNQNRLADLRVLVVEDGIDNQIILREYLESEGAVVAIAANGHECLQRDFVKAPFDVILMDIQMPEVDGLTATRELRRRGMITPIVALTANALRGEQERCVMAGCTDYLTKPINVERLISTLARLGGKALCQEVGLLSAADRAAPNVLGPIISQLINDPRVNRVLGGFIERLPWRVSEIAKAVAANDQAQVARLAHALKGTAGNYGYPKLVEVAAAIETAAQHEDDKTLGSHIAILATVVERVQAGSKIPAPV